jgi:hypothetical protein
MELLLRTHHAASGAVNLAAFASVSVSLVLRFAASAIRMIFPRGYAFFRETFSALRMKEHDA